MKSFWQELPVPFAILAPMEGVTDVVFRQIIAQIGKPDVFFTEFTSCDGLVSVGSEKVAQSLKFFNSQKPVVAQLWGSNPETFFLSAQYCKELGFSGIDINMGCPDKSMPKKGACSALINNPSLAKEIIMAAKKGGTLPVSVKTRLASNDLKSQDWFSFLLEQDLAALTIHLRTVEELSKVPAHWEYMLKIMNLRNKIAPKTLIVGNGDVSSYAEIEDKYKLYGCEGYMIGRGVFTNPWVFNKTVNTGNITTLDRLDLYLRHIKLFDSTWGGLKNPANLKKFSKSYINNFSEASLLREKIMLSKNTKEMTEIISAYKKTLNKKERFN